MAEWAILVSVASLIIALAALTWNIWSKFIVPKPRTKFWGFALAFDDEPECALVICARNYGPGSVVLTTLRAIFPDNGRADLEEMFLNPKKLKKGVDLPFEKTPKILASGEECYFFVRWLENRPDLYMRDSYDRHHRIRSWPKKWGPPGSHFAPVRDPKKHRGAGFFFRSRAELDREIEEFKQSKGL